MASAEKSTSIARELKALLTAKDAAGKPRLSADAFKSLHAAFLLQVMAVRGSDALSPDEQSVVAAFVKAAAVPPKADATAVANALKSQLAKAQLPKDMELRMKEVLTRALSESGGASAAAKAFSKFQADAKPVVSAADGNAKGIAGSAMARHLADAAMKPNR
jgi:hypothetical protein